MGLVEFIPVVLFYCFSLALVASGVMVISVKNPVHAVLFLIFAFFNAAGLFLLLGAELVAMLLIIVYVGAVMVLFLFIVMMLDINFAEMKDGFLRYLPIGLVAAVIFFCEIFFAVRLTTLEYEGPPGGIRIPIDLETSNAKAIGDVLYTDYILAFQVSGLILLVAMVGAIVLTLRTREGVKRQKVSEQTARKGKDSIKMVKVKPRSGI